MHDISRVLAIHVGKIAGVQPPLPSEKNWRRGVCDSSLLIVHGEHVIFPERLENDLIGCYS